ncbi:MAG: hypothetical protein WCY97_01830 [Methanothrix sp.]|jgi:hypothetical protein|uniref:Uncharacterized protein n=1 Tax=Methanothrix harundinacea TaxID=301375 RepID=A0A101IJS2_9EURY|nr:MAG: hypothetical protein XD72_0959 [Methanothrix harundinacea]MDD2638351.1 hypothetical protein [Methanothrix sp.]MDI9399383.1 hypothetical protein [Euryarchaeota archaeon]KUK96556.1 MAG: hypothetical protein XE07_1024 [Methanothrix harundinacea]MCP1391541.1 hypothetical protein [Methanothrix harundinacea]
MKENKFGWKVGDGLRWTSPEGCDHDCVVTRAMAQMIEFETGEGEMKRLKGNNPSISRIDDSPHEAEPMTAPESRPESGLESKTEPKVESEQKTELERGTAQEPAAETPAKPGPERAAECEPVEEPAFAASGAVEKISERRAEVDLTSGGVVEISVQVRESGSGPRASDKEFRLNGGGEWRSSLEEALDAEYDRSWMCIRVQGR